MSKKNGNGNWRNRIVGSGEESPDQLMANPANFRVHPKAQQAALEGSLDTLGWIQQVLVNRHTQTVIDGHLRVALALRHNAPTVPVLYVDLSPEEEQQALLSLDPIAAMAATDKAKLDELLHQVQSDDERVQQFLSELAEREGIDYGAPPPEDPGAQIDRAEELRQKWGVELGQLWQLGEHRLICGDCTDRATVERVMMGEKIDLILTDPPYGINIVKGLSASVGGGKPVTIGTICHRQKYPFGGVKNKGKVGGGNWVDATLYSPVEGDDKPFDPDHLLQMDGEKILFGGNYYASRLPDSRCWIVWDKNNTGNFADAELAWTSFDKGVRLYHFTWNGLLRGGDRKIEGKNRVHPTQKPVGLFEMILQDFSEEKQIICDFYLGSGTTLIACERLGRKCRACEISPGYVSVALERWAQMTGKTPELIDTFTH